MVAALHPIPRPAAHDGTVVDLTHRVVSEDELRRRAAEGDQQAIAELAARTFEREAEEVRAA